MRAKRDVRHGCNDDADTGVKPEGDDEQRRGRVEVEENETRRDMFKCEFGNHWTVVGSCV
jgi:hypothetical protein